MGPIRGARTTQSRVHHAVQIFCAALHYLWGQVGSRVDREATPSVRRARADLLREIRAKDRSVAFVRLHAIYQHPDLCAADHFLRPAPSSSILPARPRKRSWQPCRRPASVRSGGLKKGGQGRGITFHEDTANAASVIDEYYAVWRRPHSAMASVRIRRLSTWTSFARSAPSTPVSSRCDADDAILCWDFCLVEGIRAQAEYGEPPPKPVGGCANPGPGLPGRRYLARDGVREFDLMGAHSPRCPDSLASASTRSRSPPTSQTFPEAWDMPHQEEHLPARCAAKAIKDWRARS